MKKFLSRRIGCVAIAALTFLASAKNLPAAAMYGVWTSEAGVYAPVWVTKEANLFAKYGIQMQLIFIQGASLAAAALISGDAQIGFLSPQVVLTSTMNGLDLVMIGRMGNYIENHIYGRKGITSLKQIKSLAISRFGSSADFVGRVLVERAGLKPDSEVAFLQFGNQSNRLAALDTGRADAAIVTPPMTLQARKMGFPILADGAKLAIPYSSNMMVVKRSYLGKNRDAVRNALKAMIEGVHFYKTNTEQTLKVISKYMKIQDREVLEENLRGYDFPLKPYPAKEYFELPMQEVGRKDPRVLKENPERFADSSLVKELDDSGFIDKLTREYGLKK